MSGPPALQEHRRRDRQDHDRGVGRSRGAGEESVIGGSFDSAPCEEAIGEQGDHQGNDHQDGDQDREPRTHAARSQPDIGSPRRRRLQAFISVMATGRHDGDQQEDGQARRLAEEPERPRRSPRSGPSSPRSSRSGRAAGGAGAARCLGRTPGDLRQSRAGRASTPRRRGRSARRSPSRIGSGCGFRSLMAETSRGNLGATPPLCGGHRAGARGPLRRARGLASSILTEGWVVRRQAEEKDGGHQRREQHVGSTTPRKMTEAASPRPVIGRPSKRRPRAGAQVIKPAGTPRITNAMAKTEIASAKFGPAR